MEAKPKRKPKPPLKLYLGDVVELKKAHPCGSNEWEIIRLGAQVKLKCRGCGRVVMLPRSRLQRRIKRFIERPLAPKPLSGRTIGPGEVGDADGSPA